MNKKTKQTLTKLFFYMRQQSSKCRWRIEKPLKLREDLAMEEKNNQDFISKSSPLSCFLCVM